MKWSTSGGQMVWVDVNQGWSIRNMLVYLGFTGFDPNPANSRIWERSQSPRFELLSPAQPRESKVLKPITVMGFDGCWNPSKWSASGSSYQTRIGTLDALPTSVASSSSWHRCNSNLTWKNANSFQLGPWVSHWSPVQLASWRSHFPICQLASPAAALQ